MKNTKSDIFLKKQLVKTYNLKVDCDSIVVCKMLILEVLKIFESNIKVIGGELI